MAREQDATQAARAAASHIAPVTLVKLTVYSDRTVPTVAETFYLSNLPVEYDYGDTGTDQIFLPVVIGGGELFSGMGSHLAKPDDSTSLRRSFELQCLNTQIASDTLRLAELLQAYNMEGASIEVSQLLLGEDEMAVLPLDLTAYTGDEHLVFFRGRVNQVAPITDSFLTIQCTSELPTMADSWNYAWDATKVDPVDLGKRLPRVYGNAKHVQCINYDVGSEFTLAEPLDASETGAGYEISDGSGLPAGVFNLRVDGEEMECQDAAAKTLKINTRGVGPTSGAAHIAGALAVELIATATYVVSDRESSALDELYVINPLNGVLLRLNSDDLTWVTNLADTTTISGQTITTVQFSSANLQALMDYFEAQSAAAAPASVSQQPVFTTPTTEVIRIPLTAAETTDPALEPSAIAGPLGSIATIAYAASLDLRVTVHDVGTNYEGISLWVPTGGAPDNTRTCKRFRVMVRNTNEENPTAAYTIRLNFDFFGENGLISQVMDAGTDVLYGDIFASGWVPVSGSPALSTMERSSAPSSGSDPNFLSVYLDAGGPTSIYGGIIIEDAWVECELDAINSPNPTPVAVTGGGGGGSSGFGLRFFADLSGITGGLQEGGESFDSGTWETNGCSAAYDPSIKQEGTNSLKVTVDTATVGESAGITTDSLTGWTGTGATLALVDEGHTEGSYAIEAVADAASAASVEFYNAGLGLDLELTATPDFYGYYLQFDMKVKHSGSTSFIHIRVGTDSDNYYESDQGIDQWPEDTWHTLGFSLSGDTTGSPDPTDINYFAVFFNDDGGTPSADCAVYIDKVELVWTRPMVQNNGLSVDLSSPGPDYYMWVRFDAEPDDTHFDNANFDVNVFITDSAGSGTTRPAVYRDIEFDPLVTPGVYDEVWQNLKDNSVNDTGTPDLENVQTMNITFVMPLKGIIVPRGAVFVFHVDFFRRGAVSFGAHPAGVILHHIADIGGETVDTDSYDALVIALGVDAEWGFDLRSIGFTWEEILTRMAYEARCNIIAVEETAGRVWKLLSADNDYGFGASPSTAIITQTHDITDVGRSADDIASYFSFRYGFDASLPGGGSEEGFKYALEANPDVSDVPITTTIIGNAAARFGARDSGPIAFRCIQDEATAQDTAGYYVQELIANDRRVYELTGVAWFDALPYDVGDIVSITPPWASSATTCRIISMSKTFESNTWTITAIEVLVTGTRTP